METIEISKHKLSCLIEAATSDCGFCPAFRFCKPDEGITCDEHINEWLNEKGDN